MKFALAMFVCAAALGAEPGDGVIQTAQLDAARPYFVPTHPRVTTTIRFPHEIGAPDGAVPVFTEDPANAAAEYLITWQSGDAYFTVVPLANARMANLNVPYEGRTYVLYFYPVSDQLKAVAAVNLGGAGAGPAGPRPPSDAAPVTRAEQLPADRTPPLTPARLVGFIDRLKLIHATAAGPDLDALVRAMNVQVAIAREESGAPAGGSGAASGGSAPAATLGSGLNDGGLFQVVLLRAVRDPRLNCLGFICLVRNTSDQVLAFDVNSFGARAGAEYLGQRISDATPILKPREQAAAYFVVQPTRNTPLRADNAWKISVDLVSPRLNPGAALSRGFAEAVHR